MKSNWHLKRIYGWYNRAWFGGRLPVNAVCVFGKLETQAQVEFHGNDAPVITISPRVRKCGWNAVKFTMLHEMSHVSVVTKYNRRMGHGARFQEEMMRLAKRGAFRRLW